MIIGLANGSLGTLNLSGGNISSFNGKIAYNTNTTGVVNVSNGDWSITYGLDIGREGNGMLNLSGGNVIVNSGYNTLSGSGTINLGLGSSASGTINLGDGATVGTLQASRVTGGNGTAVVNFNHTGNYTFDPILAGSLSLNKLGTGTTILSANNTYTGATTITAGTLTISGAGQLGSGSYSGNISNAGTLNYASSANQTLSGIISGTGALTKDGASTLTLTGVETYTGATTINAGTLTISSAGQLGSGSYSGNISNAGVFNYASSANQTLSGTISGTGALTKNGGGTLTLNGTNTYNGSTIVNAGTLNANSTNALGSNNTVQVTGGTLLVTADDAINGMTVTLNSTSTDVAGLAFDGTYSGLVDNLTLSKNSIIDLGDGSVSIMFDTFVMSTYTLDIYNWTGTTLWGGGTGNDTDRVYYGPDLSDVTLANIRFHSGAVGGGDSFVGSGYDLGLQQTSFDPGLSGNQIIPVPEPETYATGLLLLLGGAWWMWKRKPKAV